MYVDGQARQPPPVYFATGLFLHSDNSDVVTMLILKGKFADFRSDKPGCHYGDVIKITYRGPADPASMGAAGVPTPA